MQTYSILAFADPVKKLQERSGSRCAYARQEGYTHLMALSMVGYPRVNYPTQYIRKL